MTIESSFAEWKLGFRDVGTDLGDDWSTEGNVRHEVSVHDVDVQPVGATGDGAAAFVA